MYSPGRINWSLCGKDRDFRLNKRNFRVRVSPKGNKWYLIKWKKSGQENYGIFGD